jgi:hypothetical protein
MSTAGRRYRSRDVANNLIGLSISYEHDPLLARGLGLEHLRELLLRIARPLLRQGANLAYAGHWRRDGAEGASFTYEILRLISAEQEDNTLGGPDTSLSIGRLYNHASWPRYLDVTPQIEAEWINCCRIVRVTQAQAGISPEETVADADVGDGSDRGVFNAAVVLSAMRRSASEGTSIVLPDVPITESVPPVSARVLLGGKLTGYSGFAPGILEEALYAMEKGCPVYVIGGFGGAAEVLARALLGGQRPEELTAEWHFGRTPGVARLRELTASFRVPDGARKTDQLLDAVYARAESARGAIGSALNTGLSEDDTRELLSTRDVGRVVQLVRRGLMQRGLKPLPA